MIDPTIYSGTSGHGVRSSRRDQEPRQDGKSKKKNKNLSHRVSSNRVMAGTKPSPQFSAYTSVPILSGLPLQIECICGFDDYVIVGTKEGHLLIYEINSNPGISSPEIVHSNKNFSKKAIMQLDVIPEYKILVSLTENGISIYDLSLNSHSRQCQFIATLSETNGASCFALDIQRKISLTGVLAITARMCVVVGKGIQFFYYSWKERAFLKLRENVTISEVPKCIIWCNETICLGLKSEYVTIDVLSGTPKTVCMTGRSGDMVMTPASENSFAIAKEKQAIVIYVSQDGSIDSKSPHLEKKQMIIEKMKKNSNDQINIAFSWTDTPSALVYDEPYFVGIIGNKTAEVRTAKPILKFDSFQLNNAKFLYHTKPGNVFVASSNSIWLLKAWPANDQMDFFVKNEQFELALSLEKMWQEDGDIKAAKIGSIKILYAVSLFNRTKFIDAINIFLEKKTDVSHVIGLFPDLLPDEFRCQLEYPVTIAKLRGKDLENALSALIDFLTVKRNLLLSFPNNSVKDSTPLFEGGTIIVSKRQLLQIIDTTLLKCYLQVKEPLVAPLLRIKGNYCHLEESERALIEHSKLDELIILYQNRGLHRKALQLLVKQNDVDRGVKYLQNLGGDEIELILEFASEILSSDPDKGLKIFIEDLQEIEQLPRPKIYDFLSKSFPSLVIPYLQHVINVWDDTRALFHNALVHAYRKTVMALEKDCDERNEYRTRLQKFLRKSSYYTPEMVLFHFPYDDLHEERGILLEKLGKHEEALYLYILVLQDMDQAKAYCKRVYNKNDKSSKDVFLMLIKILINPLPSVSPIPGIVSKSAEAFRKAEADIKNITQLLQEFVPYLDPGQVLNYLPDDLAISEIKDFLKVSVQKHMADKRKLLIQKGLVHAEYLRMKQEKVICQSERFVVNYATCFVCRKSLKSQSAFARYPDGSIVHFSCQPNML